MSRIAVSVLLTIVVCRPLGAGTPEQSRNEDACEAQGQAAAASAPSETELLRGPALAPDRATVSLVRRNFEGVIEKLTIRPEEAALKLIELTETERGAVQTVLSARASAFDRLFREELDAILEIGPAFESGQVLRGLHLLGRLYESFAAIAGEKELLDQLAEVLPVEKAARLRALVNEYTDALVFQELGLERAGADGAAARLNIGQRIKAAVLRRQIAIEHFGLELQQAAERTFRGDDDGKFEALLNKLDLTPEQRKAIYKDAITFAQRSMGMEGESPEKEAIAELLLQVYDRLDEAQRRKLFEAVILSE